RDAVLDYRADIGVALDGDADRVIICDEKGEIIDGDQIIGLIAKFWQRRGRLKGGGIVSTIMANLGLEQYLGSLNLSLERTRVGDRYVVEAMRAKGMNIGGEPSGHVILSDFSTTGDGLGTALQLLAVIASEGIAVSDACRNFDPFPQLLKNVKYKAGDPLSAPAVKAAIAGAEQAFGKGGRVVIRKSGTEPVIRVMAEGENDDLVRRTVDEICAVIEAETPA
ncbi:MAG: phosphoglucosamine mutase, partial [Pseudomonadota bacterium]